MGLIEIEKVRKSKKVKRKTRPYYDNAYVRKNLNSLNNVAYPSLEKQPIPPQTNRITDVYNINSPKSINNTYQASVKSPRPTALAPQKSSPSPGMVGSRIQTEGNIINMCLRTFILSSLTLSFIIIVGFIIMIFGNKYINLFPTAENYTAEEFNLLLRHSFMIIFGIISLLSIISMITINHHVKKRFRYHYLSKINIFIYDTFVVIQTAFLYICEMWVMFQVVNSLYKSFLSYQTDGLILGNVNIDAINVLKYIIVIIMTTFIVINSFSSVDIIHEKNKFVFENQI